MREEDDATPFGPLPPELEGLLLSVTGEVGVTASLLADTWYARPTADLRDERRELIAMVSILSMVEDAEELSDRVAAWQASDELTHALASLSEVKTYVPFTPDEVAGVKEIQEAWDYRTTAYGPQRTKFWLRPLSEEAQALVGRWHSWLREPEPDSETGELFISNEAGHLYMACVSLYYRLDGREKP
jgi:hypothetical protein